jgi:hypothetical protein
MTEYRLDTFVQVTLDASGAGSVSNVGPTVYGEKWHITLFSAKGPNTARLEIFRGPSKIDGTEFADNDTSSTDITLQLGETLRFAWTNGTVGNIMQCYLSGDRTVRGNRSYGI